MSNTILHSLGYEEKKRLKEDLKDFYITYRDSLELPKNAYFGCEIEFEIPEYTNFFEVIDYMDWEIHNFIKEKYHYSYPWTCKREHGGLVEITSSVLSDEKKNWKLLEKTLTFLKENKFIASVDCGAHVHVCNHVIGKNYKDWINFLKIYACYENEILKFTNGENHFIRPRYLSYAAPSRIVILSNLSFLETLPEKMELPRDLYSKSHSLSFWYETLHDLVNTLDAYLPYEDSSINTTEFRSPNGTLNEIIWQNNINFLVKMMSSLTSSDFDIEFLDYRYKNETEKNKIYRDKEFELCDLVFRNDYDKYSFLRQYYKDFENPILGYDNGKSKSFWK